VTGLAVHVKDVEMVYRVDGQDVIALSAVDLQVDPGESDPVPGQELRIGDVVLRVVLPTPRCIVAGLQDEEAAVDRQLLTALARHHRTGVGNWAGRRASACTQRYCALVSSRLARSSGSRLAIGQDRRAGVSHTALREPRHLSVQVTGVSRPGTSGPAKRMSRVS